jgi:hypothetical protein
VFRSYPVFPVGWPLLGASASDVFEPARPIQAVEVIDLRQNGAHRVQESILSRKRVPDRRFLRHYGTGRIRRFDRPQTGPTGPTIDQRNCTSNPPNSPKTLRRMARHSTATAEALQVRSDQDQNGQPSRSRPAYPARSPTPVTTPGCSILPSGYWKLAQRCRPPVTGKAGTIYRAAVLVPPGKAAGKCSSIEPENPLAFPRLSRKRGC